MHKTFLAVLALVFLNTPALAQRAHEHGAADANLTVDGSTLSLELESPLANFLSFEHAPTTAKEQAEAMALVEQMRKETLFQPTEEAECKERSRTIASAALPNVSTKAESAEHGHADVDFAVTWTCARPEKLKSLRTTLFRTFPALKTVRVQMLLPESQDFARLSAESDTLRW